MPGKTIHSTHAVLAAVRGGHETDEILWQGLVNVLCKKSPEVVTTIVEVLHEFGSKVEGTQFRGQLVCQSLSGK